MHQCSHPGRHLLHSAVTHASKKLEHAIATPHDTSLCLAAWEEELHDDEDQDFILSGIKHGFDIIDKDAVPTPVECNNHKSAQPGSLLYDQATAQILKESPPPRVDDAAALVTEDCFIVKVDLQSAYRSVKISDHSKQITGLKWQFGNRTVYLWDIRLCFGSKLSPGIFHRLTQAVRRMLIRRGLMATVVYLDDFFIKADTLKECAEAMNLLIALLRKINWKKVVDPSTKIVFLGIEIVYLIKSSLRFDMNYLSF